MSGPFEFVNDISDKKKNLIETEADEKEYVPFIVNRAFSNFPDTIFYANEANRLGQLDKKLQHDYLFHSVPKKKRWSKWNKKKTDENIALISEYYKYSVEKARAVSHLFTDDQLEIIRKTLEQGGVQKK
jgi:hypothetical protein